MRGGRAELAGDLNPLPSQKNVNFCITTYTCIDGPHPPPHTHKTCLQEVDPRRTGSERHISPDILRWDNCGEAALVFTPPCDSGEGALQVLAYNMGTAASHAQDRSSLLLDHTRLAFLGGDHYRHCEAMDHVHILIGDLGVVGVAGTLGRLLPGDPSGVPGFHRCDVDVLAGVMAANGGHSVRGVEGGSGLNLCQMHGTENCVMLYL